MTKGYKGNLSGIDFDIIEDPNCPPHTFYFLNKDYLEFPPTSLHPLCNCKVVTYSRWQRIKNWFKRLLQS